MNKYVYVVSGVTPYSHGEYVMDSVFATEKTAKAYTEKRRKKYGEDFLYAVDKMYIKGGQAMLEQVVKTLLYFGFAFGLYWIMVSSQDDGLDRKEATDGEQLSESD